MVTNTDIHGIQRKYLEDLNGKISKVQFERIKNLSFLRVRTIPKIKFKSLSGINSTRFIFQDVLSGFHSSELPLIFILVGTKNNVKIYVGTDLTNTNKEGFITLLKNSHPGIGFFSEKDENESPEKIYTNDDIIAELKPLKFATTVIGSPSLELETEKTGYSRIDRLIRTLFGLDWALIVENFPIKYGDIRKKKESVLSELSHVLNDIERKDPNAIYYKQLLDSYFTKVQNGLKNGLWNSSVFLLTKKNSGVASGILRSVFSDEDAEPDSLKALTLEDDLIDNVSSISVITVPMDDNSKKWYPFKFQSLMNSNEVSSISQLPMMEMPGYFIEDYADFDTSTTILSGDTITVGNIIVNGHVTSNEYQIEVNDMSKHALVVGTTGSGKTNTIILLLYGLYKNSKNFLIIEPVKSEYRDLLAHKVFSDSKDENKENIISKSNIQIFTLGDNNISPFRINPFEIGPNVSVQTHIDMIKSLFNSSFIMYSPMPYVLEEAIHEIYVDKGWDLVTGKNFRENKFVNKHDVESFPTLTDLYKKIDSVVDRLGYHKRITMDVKAALKTRINSLRIGGKGLMLDTKKSISFEDILKRSTILELEKIGDDDEKSFVMGLLLIFLYEYYVAKGISKDSKLNHVTVIEEAHRLLKNVAYSIDTELANMKGKSVEMFSNMLSEIRAYGEGLIVVEQIPTKLSPDIIKNSNLKIMHRIVDIDDRNQVGSSMNIEDETEIRKIASLNPGEAVVYSGGDDKPLLIKRPWIKLNQWQESKENQDKEIRKYMQTKYAAHLGIEDAFREVDREEIFHISPSTNRSFLYNFSHFILSVVLNRDPRITEKFTSLLEKIQQLHHNKISKENAFKILEDEIEEYFKGLGKFYAISFSDTDLVLKQFKDVVAEIFKNFERKDYEIKRDDPKISLFRKNYLELIKKHRSKDLFHILPEEDLMIFAFNAKIIQNDVYLKENFERALSFKGNKGTQKILATCYDASKHIMMDWIDLEHLRNAAVCYGALVSESTTGISFQHHEKLIRIIRSKMSKYIEDKIG